MNEKLDLVAAENLLNLECETEFVPRPLTPRNCKL